MFAYFLMIETPEEQEKFEKFYLVYRQRMYQIAFSILRNKQDAEEAVQDSFLSILSCLDKLNEEECHKTWNYIVTIVKNNCFNKHKKKKRFLNISYEDYMKENEGTDGAMDLADQIIQKEQITLIAELIQQLSYPYKEVLYLQYYNNMNGKEIANILDKSPENIRQISKRAKKKLEQLFRERNEENFQSNI